MRGGEERIFFPPLFFIFSGKLNVFAWNKVILIGL